MDKRELINPGYQAFNGHVFTERQACMVYDKELGKSFYNYVVPLDGKIQFIDGNQLGIVAFFTLLRLSLLVSAHRSPRLQILLF